MLSYQKWITQAVQLYSLQTGCAVHYVLLRAFWKCNRNILSSQGQC
jgi:hypothetical protein